MPVSVRNWQSSPANAGEFFFIIRPQGQRDFLSQVDEVFDLYQAALVGAGLGAHSGVAISLFLSDAANQEELLRRHPGFARALDGGAAISVVEQPPAGAKVALAAYHIRRPPGTERRQALSVRGAKPTATGLAITSGPYRFFYLKNLISPVGGGAGQQTEDLLGGLEQATGTAITLPEVVRTWLYVHDIDYNYRDVSGARNRVFDRFGMNATTGFPASTGIAGRTAEAADLLALDVLAIQGLEPGQSRRMEAPTHMNPTVEYQVRFERGRQVVFGDRRHLYVSGTASIDNQGRILHPGDVVRQTERAVENVAALLGECGARLEDLRYTIVYVRDASDADTIDEVMAKTGLGDVPRLIVHAPVCRPGWLMELEGVAIDGHGDRRFAPF